jgi:hypothetical protein
LTLRTLTRSRAALPLEIMALRHQLAVLQRSRPRRVRLAKTDRWLWVLLSRLGTGWRTARVIVKTDRRHLHRRGFHPWWTWKSRRRLGRPTVPANIRTLIREMAEANPRWGAPWMHGELLKLGLDVCQATVAKDMGCRRQLPSQTWRTFLSDHVGQIVAADFHKVRGHSSAECQSVSPSLVRTDRTEIQQLREAFRQGWSPAAIIASEIRDRHGAPAC